MHVRVCMRVDDSVCGSEPCHFIRGVSSFALGRHAQASEPLRNAALGVYDERLSKYTISSIQVDLLGPARDFPEAVPWLLPAPAERSHPHASRQPSALQ